MEYKALTFINLPFIERRFAPGQMIDRSEFEEYAKAAADAHIWPPDMDEDHSGAPDADEVINHMIEWGSISEDPDTPLHPDHIPPTPGVPTIQQMVEQAKALVADLEERGAEVPAELRTLAETDYQHVTAAEEGQGGDQHV